MRYAGEVLALPRVVAIVSPENERSIALLEKLGFSFEGTIRMAPALHQELLLERLACEQAADPDRLRARR